MTQENPTFDIVFISGNLMTDYIAYTMLCCVAAKAKRSITLVEVTDPHFQTHLRAALALPQPIKVYCSKRVFLGDIPDWAQDFVDHVLVTVSDMLFYYPDAITRQITDGMIDIMSDTDMSLPYVTAFLLFKKMGVIEAANLLAHKWMTCEHYDITRDPEITDIINPRRTHDN